jgi:hypothetical protein
MDLTGGEELQLTINLLDAHDNEGAPDDMLRIVGTHVRDIVLQKCTHVIAKGAFGKVYNICAVYPCSSCFALKLPTRDDIDKTEYLIQEEVFSAFFGWKSSVVGDAYDLTHFVPKPLSFFKYIEAGIAGGAFARPFAGGATTPYSAASPMGSRSRNRQLNQRSNAQRDRRLSEYSGFGLPAMMAAAPPGIVAPVAIAPGMPVPAMPTLAAIQAQNIVIDPPEYKHGMLSSLLMGTSAHKVMKSDTVTFEQFYDIMMRTFMFVTEAVDRVPGFRHNDLHTGNVNVHGSIVTVLDYGLSSTNKHRVIRNAVQNVLKNYGNWDCWRFLGYAIESLLLHIHKQHYWALRILKHIRLLLQDDTAFAFCMETDRVNHHQIRDAIAWGGAPFRIPLTKLLIGADKYLQPVVYITGDERRPMVLPGFDAIQARLTPRAFMEHFLQPPLP